MSVVADDIVRIATVDKARGYWATVFRRLSRDKVAVVCASIILLIALAAILAGMSIMSGGRFGRWIGYIWAILVIVQGFALINLTPWYSFAMIALAAFVIYGLASNPRNVTS